MIDTDKYYDGPDDERLIALSKRELRLMVWAYGDELRNMKEDSTHTDNYTLAEVKRLRLLFHKQGKCYHCGEKYTSYLHTTYLMCEASNQIILNTEMIE